MLARVFKEHHYNGACYGKCGEFMPGGMYKGQWNQGDSRDNYAFTVKKENQVDLTFKKAQEKQPWTLPYSKEVEQSSISHILGSHCALHAAKSVGKLATVFEALDHPSRFDEIQRPNESQLETIKAMSADLVTAALRFANLYKFDLETELKKRVLEKNGVGY